MRQKILELDVERSIAVNLRANRPPLDNGQIRSAILAMREAIAGASGCEANAARALSQAEVAQTLGCSRWSIRRMVETGQLTPRKLLGGLIRFDRKEVEALLTGGRDQ